MANVQARENSAVVNDGYELVDIDRLSEHPDNPRRGDIEAIATSIDANGFYGAVVVQRSTGRIIAGNHRFKAARSQGMVEIPVIYADVDDAAARRILLADNRTNDLAGYDDAALGALLAELKADDDLLGTGYDEAAVDALLAELATDEPPATDNDPDAIPAAPINPVTVAGDIWQLGPHRVICGDARDLATVERLLDGAAINVAFTSPPYASQRKYDESSGFKPIPPGEYVEWFEDVQANVRTVLADDGSWFINIKPASDGLDTELYVFDLVLAHARRWGWHFATEFCWERNGVPKNVTRRFKNQFEPIYQFTSGDWKMRPDAVRHWSENVPIPGGPGVGNTSWADAQGGNAEMFGARKRKNGKRGGLGEDLQGTNWQPGEFIHAGMAYPGNRLPTFANSHTATGHTAAFPVGLPAFFIKAFSDQEDNVYDPFMGSGSTLIAAHLEGRVAYGVEISPAYVDVICRRWQELTGKLPVRNGAAHDFIEQP